LDAASADRLARSLTELIELGAQLPKGAGGGNLTGVHWGAYLAPESASAFEATLAKRGLITYTKEPDRVILPPGVKLLVLIAYAHMLRVQLLRRGVIMYSVSDSSDLVNELDTALEIYHRTIGGPTYASLAYYDLNYYRNHD